MRIQNTMGKYNKHENEGEIKVNMINMSIENKSGYRKLWVQKQKQE